MVGGLDELRTKLNRTLSVAAVAVLVAAGCDRAAEAGGRPPQKAGSAAGMKIDSILPPGEALRRFQSELPAVTELDDAARGRDELVSEFITALERADTASLATLAVSKAEYAFLYFPSSAYSRKPYELAPDIAWFLNEQNSQKGATRILHRLSGRDLGFSSYTCDSPVTEQENVFWRDCRVKYVDPASSRPVARKLFGTIMRRGERYKFLSYANDF
jgi:hypothetical protein